jgi:sulfatase modifying factor 1
LYDMRGNVMEWVQDWYGPYSAERQVDPQGVPSSFGRVCRGGSWSRGDTGPFRCASRFNLGPAYQIDRSGFRCARTF